MENSISIKDWQSEFALGHYDDASFKTQCEAGWWDWFCKDASLANKTRKMGKIILKVKEGGKVDLNNWYVWFKNNCPLNGPLYDDFRFARKDTGDVMFTIQINCCWSKHKYTVWGRKVLSDGKYEEHFGRDNEPPMFECDDSRELVNWLNKPWEESKNAYQK